MTTEGASGNRFLPDSVITVFGGEVYRDRGLRDESMLAWAAANTKSMSLIIRREQHEAIVRARNFYRSPQVGRDDWFSSCNLISHALAVNDAVCWTYGVHCSGACYILPISAKLSRMISSIPTPHGGPLSIYQWATSYHWWATTCISEGH